MQPKEGTLTHKQLLEKAQQINLDAEGEVKLVRVIPSEWNRNHEGWIVTEHSYLLSRRGWRKQSTDSLFYDRVEPEEFDYHPRQLLFDTALEAADFYYSHCLGREKKPAFDFEIVKLRDYLGNKFTGEDWDEVVKAAISIRRK